MSLENIFISFLTAIFSAVISISTQPQSENRFAFVARVRNKSGEFFSAVEGRERPQIFALEFLRVVAVPCFVFASLRFSRFARLRAQLNECFRRVYV